jgi:hypothetical protein
VDVPGEPVTAAALLLEAIEAAGIEVNVDPAGGLACTGPVEAMTPELAARIGANVDALVAHLVAARDRAAMERIDAVLGTDRWGAEFDPDEDLPGVRADGGSVPPKVPVLSATGRSWRCPCGATVVVGWAVCSFCGTRGDHLWAL